MTTANVFAETVMATVQTQKTYTDVLTFIPNLIGYARVALTFTAYYFALPSDQPFLYDENATLEKYEGPVMCGSGLIFYIL